MKKRLIVIGFVFLSSCGPYNFACICGDGSNPQFVSNKTVSPETQLSAPITGQGTASTGTASQNQTNTKEK